MIDLGVSKLALIGAVALIVIGPEKLPGVARMMGTMLGKAQRYISDIKAEVNRSIELDELKKMKESIESAAKDVSHSIHQNAADFEKSWNEVTDGASSGLGNYGSPDTEPPEYRHPKKNWRLKQGNMPNWYKARTGMRTHALSGAARVARYRPKNYK